MFKVIATDVVISKGFDNAPALRFSEKGDSVRFRIGKKVYDTRAENNTRWFNVSVKAFGDVCERIKKMQLKEGSFVHLTGRLDEESWTDQSNVHLSYLGSPARNDIHRQFYYVCVCRDVFFKCNKKRNHEYT